MAKKKQQEEEVLVDVGSSISKVEQFFENNRQAITGIAIAVFVGVGGYFAYQNFYLQPREQKAQAAIYQAQMWFKADSLEQAVKGMNNQPGFLDIAADYSGTKTGNLANYYAGISYLRMGQYENAIRLLDEFNTDDPILAVEAKGAIGDAFMELNQTEEALDYYEAASNSSSNSYVVPFYLYKAGLVAERLGDLEAAQGYYQTIKEEYPEAKQAADIEKYLMRVKAKMEAEA